jgi:hypothetical protein
VPHLPGRPSQQREDVPELQRDGSVVSQLRADSPCGWLGDVPGREEVRSRSTSRLSPRGVHDVSSPRATHNNNVLIPCEEVVNVPLERVEVLLGPTDLRSASEKIGWALLPPASALRNSAIPENRQRTEMGLSTVVTGDLSPYRLSQQPTRVFRSA